MREGVPILWEHPLLRFCPMLRADGVEASSPFRRRAWEAKRTVLENKDKYVRVEIRECLLLAFRQKGAKE
ncbi:hypothetical protein GsuE55_09630 [Geobacillus subterraneus]|uniref:Uncharacterized protein n=1 Tax=Geobacillus subterraneus TaxID=129338 RepID=A0A679FK19_9BACL|nr:hypothetical protein GsuE55_09630 [Geobacillus subterraneus]